MPLIRISVPQALTTPQLQHISASIHAALVDVFKAPAADQFQIFHRHPADELVVTPEYLDIRHTGNVAFVQITCNEGRSTEQKRDLYARIAADIARGGAISAADVIINVIEVKKENWSFGNGLAPYAS